MNGDLYNAHLRANPVKTLANVGKRTGNYGKQMGVFSQVALPVFRRMS